MYCEQYKIKFKLSGENWIISKKMKKQSQKVGYLMCKKEVKKSDLFLILVNYLFSKMRIIYYENVFMRLNIHIFVIEIVVHCFSD